MTWARMLHSFGDQEIAGSNPLAPTNSLESASYSTRKSEERLVPGQDVDGSNPFVPTIVLFFKSMLYTASSTTSSASFYGQDGQLRWFCMDRKPSSLPCSIDLLVDTGISRLTPVVGSVIPSKVACVLVSSNAV